MKITDDQMAYLMGDERDPNVTLCLHKVEVQHVHAQLPGIPYAFVARFAGHVHYDNPNQDASPDEPYPNAKLVTVDMFLSQPVLQALLAESIMEQMAGAQCEHDKRQETENSDAEILADIEADVNSFLETLLREETENDD